MANIMRLGGNSKVKIVKVGTWTINNTESSTWTYNISTLYNDYKKITIDNIIFPIKYVKHTYQSYELERDSVTSVSYEPSTGVLTVKSQHTGSNANFISLSLDIYVIEGNVERI